MKRAWADSGTKARWQGTDQVLAINLSSDIMLPALLPASLPAAAPSPAGNGLERAAGPAGSPGPRCSSRLTMSLGMALGFVEFNFGDVSWALEGSETAWGRDRAEGGDAAYGRFQVAITWRQCMSSGYMEALQTVNHCSEVRDLTLQHLPAPSPEVPHLHKK